MTHLHQDGPPRESSAEPGALIRWPRRYDLLTTLALAGRGNRVRTDIADAIELGPGQDVLDVGCGTGTLTLFLAGRVGPSGSVVGVDASEPMVTAAQRKAAGTASPVRFEVATAQQLPLADESFDAVTTSLMIHHLPPEDRRGAVEEILRVLRPDGRLVIAEFQAPSWSVGRRLTEHVLGHSMATNDLDDIRELATDAGVDEVACRATKVGWLGLVTGRKPAAPGAPHV